MIGKSAFQILSLALVAAAQLTLYDVSISPAETTGPYAQAAQLVSAFVKGTGPLQATPTSVDASGVTHYVGVQELGVVPVLDGTAISIATLPTPTPITYTFRADASRAFYEYKDATSTAGIQAEVGVSIECTHDVDSDTPVEDGTIVCEGEVALLGEGLGVTIGTTYVATATGKPVAFATITNLLSESTGGPGGSNGSASNPATTDGAENDDDGMGHKSAAMGGMFHLAFIVAGVVFLL